MWKRENGSGQAQKTAWERYSWVRTLKSPPCWMFRIVMIEIANLRSLCDGMPTSSGSPSATDYNYRFTGVIKCSNLRAEQRLNGCCIGAFRNWSVMARCHKSVEEIRCRELASERCKKPCTLQYWYWILLEWKVHAALTNRTEWKTWAT